MLKVVLGDQTLAGTYGGILGVFTGMFCVWVALRGMPMSEVRAQGRPVRGASEVGRVRIVEGTRAFLRSERTLEWSRKNIAEYIGVTPALISYYYPERVDLFEAVTVPILENYLFALDDLEDRERTADGRLRALTVTFVECHTTDHNIFESYNTIVLRSGSYNGSNLITLFLDKARSLFSEKFLGDSHTDFDSRFIINALWGIAKFKAETLAQCGAEPRPNASSTAVMSSEPDKIYALFTTRIRSQLPGASATARAAGPAATCLSSD